MRSNKPYSTDQEPIRTPGKDSTTDYYLDHPAYGQIMLHRSSGNQVLYGSDFTHQYTISLTIARSQLSRALGEDRYFQREELINISMSEAQWATLVSSVGLGGGVCCTLNHVGRERQATLPHRNVQESYREEFTKDCQEALTELEELFKEIDQMGLSKAKASQLKERARKAHRKLADSIPFVASRFEEHVEKTIEDAKVEINSFLQRSVTDQGLQSIMSNGQSPFALEDQSDEA